MSKAPVFAYTAKRIKELYGPCTGTLEARFKELCAAGSTVRSFKNTVRAFEQAVCEFGEALNIPIFPAYVSDAAEVRKAAGELELTVSQYSVDISPARP